MKSPPRNADPAPRFPSDDETGNAAGSLSVQAARRSGACANRPKPVVGSSPGSGCDEPWLFRRRAAGRARMSIRHLLVAARGRCSRHAGEPRASAAYRRRSARVKKQNGLHEGSPLTECGPKGPCSWRRMPCDGGRIGLDSRFSTISGRARAYAVDHSRVRLPWGMRAEASLPDERSTEQSPGRFPGRTTFWEMKRITIRDGYVLADRSRRVKRRRLLRPEALRDGSIRARSRRRTTARRTPG